MTFNYMILWTRHLQMHLFLDRSAAEFKKERDVPWCHRTFGQSSLVDVQPGISRHTNIPFTNLENRQLSQLMKKEERHRWRWLSLKKVTLGPAYIEFRYNEKTDAMMSTYFFREGISVMSSSFSEKGQVGRFLLTISQFQSTQKL